MKRKTSAFCVVLLLLSAGSWAGFDRQDPKPPRPKVALQESQTEGQAPGTPVLIVGESGFFRPVGYNKPAHGITVTEPFLSATIKSFQVEGQQDVVKVTKESSDTVLKVEALKAGQIKVRLELEFDGFSGVVTEDAKIIVLAKPDEIPVVFHFMRLTKTDVTPTLNCTTTRLAAGDFADATKRAAVVDPIVAKMNEVWDAAGIKFTATHKVTVADTAAKQAIVNASIVDNEGFPGFVSPPYVQFFETFNEKDKLNLYFVIRNQKDPSGGVIRAATANLKAKKQPASTYKGGAVLETVYGIVIGDSALNADVAHEAGHAFGLQHIDFVVGVTAGVLDYTDLDGIDVIYHRTNKPAPGLTSTWNIMRDPIWKGAEGEPILRITDGQAAFARSQMDKAVYK